MKSSKWNTLIATALLTMSLSSQAADIEVHHAYLNAPPPVSTITAGYFMLHNNTAASVTLVRFSSPVAQKVELHKTTHNNGQMKMRKMGPLHIDGHSTVELSPGGMHLMLIKLNKNIAPGDTVPITLHFKNGTNITVSANVRDLREAPKRMDHKQHRHGDHQQH